MSDPASRTITRADDNAFQSRHHDVSSDENVYIYSGPLISRIAEALLLVLITLLLLLPVVVCNVVNRIPIRITIIMVSTICYLAILAALTRSRTMEIIIAGAT